MHARATPPQIRQPRASECANGREPLATGSRGAHRVMIRTRHPSRPVTRNEKRVQVCVGDRRKSSPREGVKAAARVASGSASQAPIGTPQPSGTGSAFTQVGSEVQVRRRHTVVWPEGAAQEEDSDRTTLGSGSPGNGETTDTETGQEEVEVSAELEEAPDEADAASASGISPALRRAVGEGKRPSPTRDRDCYLVATDNFDEMLAKPHPKLDRDNLKWDENSVGKDILMFWKERGVAAMGGTLGRSPSITRTLNSMKLNGMMAYQKTGRKTS